jgi:hypothetical protein
MVLERLFDCLVVPHVERVPGGAGSQRRQFGNRGVDFVL